MAKRRKKFTISDGDLVLLLESAPEGGYTVTSPMDPELITEGDTVEECFEMAYDAKKALADSRKKLLAELRSLRQSRRG